MKKMSDDLSKEVKKKKMLNNILLGKIPNMVKSNFCVLSKQNENPKKYIGECEHDIGGYFIINGNEKAIVSTRKNIRKQNLYI